MNRLKIVRAEKRLTQFRLSLKTGINAAKLSFVENDLVVPNLAEKRLIAKALGVPPEQIFGEEKTSIKEE